MAVIDLSLPVKNKNNEKKAVRCASAEINFTETNMNNGDTAIIFKLPPNCIVVDAGIYVKQAPSTSTATATIKVGGTNVFAPVAMGSTSGAVKSGAITKIHSGIGANVELAIGAANVTDGIVEAFVEFLEPAQSEGEYLY